MLVVEHGKVTCGPPSNRRIINNGSNNNITEWIVGSIATATCDKGYVLKSQDQVYFPLLLSL